MRFRKSKKKEVAKKLKEDATLRKEAEEILESEKKASKKSTKKKATKKAEPKKDTKKPTKKADESKTKEVDEFDFEAMRDFRSGWGFFRDRRPQHYGALLTHDGVNRVAGI